MNRWLPFALVLALLPPIAGVSAQDNKFEDLFSSYLGANAGGYLTPLAEIVTGSLNSGFVKPVRLDDGFHIRLDLQLAAAFISDSQREFQAVTEGGFLPETTTSAPTIVGAGTAKTITGEAGTAYVFPAGLAVNRTMLAIPQITVGNVAGTEASIRWFGSLEIEDVGKFSLLGLGARHSISQYLPTLPVDLAVGLHYHTVTLGDILDLSSTIVSVQASRSVDRLSVYGGLGYETSTMDVVYDPEDPDVGEIAISLDGVSGVRATAGLAVHLPGITLFGDFTLGSQNVGTFGISLGN